MSKQTFLIVAIIIVVCGLIILFASANQGVSP